MGLATRVIPVLLWDDHGCVKGKQFQPGRRIGSMHDRVRLLEKRDIDELIILDISATLNGRGPRFSEVARLCENLYCPVTIGGGITEIDDIRNLLANGADKVCLGTVAVENREFVEKAAGRFGSQAVTVSIDVKDGQIFARCGTQKTQHNPVSFAREMENLGAGELLVNSIARDGMLDGYDIPLIRDIAAAVDIPVIACGGCGDYEDIADVLSQTDAHAVAIGAAFQFRDLTPKGACRYLREHGFAVRL